MKRRSSISFIENQCDSKCAPFESLPLARKISNSSVNEEEQGKTPVGYHDIAPFSLSLIKAKSNRREKALSIMKPSPQPQILNDQKMTPASPVPEEDEPNKEPEPEEKHHFFKIDKDISADQKASPRGKEIRGKNKEASRRYEANSTGQSPKQIRRKKSLFDITDSLRNHGQTQEFQKVLGSMQKRVAPEHTSRNTQISPSSSTRRAQKRRSTIKLRTVGLLKRRKSSVESNTNLILAALHQQNSEVPIRRGKTRFSSIDRNIESSMKRGEFRQADPLYSNIFTGTMNPS